MSDKISSSELSEYFSREEELLNVMGTEDKDAEEIATQLNNVCLTEGVSNLVVYGPLNEEFYSVNCPFVWPEFIADEHAEDAITSMEKKRDMNGETWKIIRFQIYLGVLYGRLGKLNDAFKQLEIFEEHLSKNADDEFYKNVVDGLNHCIQATRAHLHFLNGDAEMADEIISGIVPFKELSKPSQAILIAVNAALIKSFGNIKNWGKVLNMMEVVIMLDSDDRGARLGQWYFITGKTIGQLRRRIHRAAMPSQKELHMLERAVSMKPLPIRLATLADSYREASCSANVDNAFSIRREVSLKMLSEAKQLYKRAVEADDQRYSILRRCGNGLMKLPHPHKDLSLAKKYLEKALSMRPDNSEAPQALGTLEERYFNTLDGALRYFQQAYENGNPISAAFIVQVRMKMDWKYNPIEDLDEFIKVAESTDSGHRAIYLVIKGEYLFFIKNDLLAAAKVWKEAITLTPKSEHVTNHVCRCLPRRCTQKPYLKYVTGRVILNVFECLKYEIRDVMRSPYYSNEEKVSLKEFLGLCEDQSEN